MSAHISTENALYRKDIDGLRAVAVLPVVAFHAGLHIARGGFIGVDVFFVISGFLITQLLLKDLHADRFPILRFYKRRIRRILPALLAVLLAVYLMGLHYCLPAEMVELSKSLVAAAFSASNVYFWLNSGYFAAPGSAKPLLHTWSLAVEEQFYIFWPLYLLMGRRFFAAKLPLLTLTIAVLSLTASVVGAVAFPSANFYLPFTRVWELAAGGLLALGAMPAKLDARARNLAAALGVALIVGSVFLIDSDMPFPGLLALPPCLGAALVILAGRDGASLPGRVLALPPIAFIGVISYSLYLWHWPISVFQKNYAFLGAGLSESSSKLLIVSVSVIAAILSWRFIEQPFRTGARRPSDPLLLWMAATATILVVALGTISWTLAGFPDRYSPRELRVAAYLNYEADDTWRVGRCFLSGKEHERKLAAECLALSSNRKNYLLLGDSHAAELWYGLRSTFTDVNFLEASAADCFPTVIHSITEASRCTAVIDDVIHNYLTHNHVDNVLLVARWKRGLLDNVAATLDWMKLHHIRVTLVGPSALYDSPLPRLVVRAMRDSDSALVQRHLNEDVRTLDAAMSQLARSHQVNYISLLDLQCAASSCALREWTSMPVIFDREHFTAEGSVLVAQRLQAARLIDQAQ